MRSRPGLLGTLLGFGVGIVAVLWACTVDKPSESLKCAVQADCGSGRICTQGYCVIGTLPPDAKLLDAAVCPAACASCNFNTTTCTINGTGGNVTCPSGWNCDVNCTTATACGMISCTGGRSCTVTCTGDAACGNIACGTGSCAVTCTASGSGSGSGSGGQACGTIACVSSCKCDVSCNPLLGCGTMTCPTRGNHYCATGGVPGEACDSNAFNNCLQTCP